MIGRVTQSTLVRELQASVGRLQRQLLAAQDTVSSQKRLREASDDPVGTERVNRLRGDLTALGALRDGVGFGAAILGAEDAALEQAQALLTRAREITTQHASGLSTPAARQAAAEEVEHLERDLLALGNTTVEGRHVFGGLARGPAPFASFDDPLFSPATAYTGPPDPFVIASGPGQSLRLTTPGGQVFQQSLQALDDLRVTLESGQAPVASLAALEAAADVLSSERASVGARMAGATGRVDEIGVAIAETRKRLGTLEGADLAEAITELTQVQVALEATLAAGSSILQTSILDFVRL